MHDLKMPTGEFLIRTANGIISIRAQKTTRLIEIMDELFTPH
jgi:hypothetical protein